ncbi:MAG TPA: DUF2950 domain-containing protein [Steroidobacteraceae bacterium]
MAGVKFMTQQPPFNSSRHAVRPPAAKLPGGNRPRNWLGVLFGTVALSMAASAAAPETTAGQSTFRTPEQAVDALVAANRNREIKRLLKILGTGGPRVLYSGDRVADDAGRAKFVATYDASHRIEELGPDKAVLIIGEEQWPMPIPLVHESNGWRFDTLAGEREILNRRIGRNELNVIEVSRAFVVAQREYARLNSSTQRTPEYAQHFVSHAGQHDGLYWPTSTGESESPLGPLMAEARSGGYGTELPNKKPKPYHGYYYRILKGQGPHAPGGAKSFVIDGHMTGGFGLLAYPAIYGDSGVMTFIVDQDGIVQERNFGPHTATVARQIEVYDPDKSWRAP